ncbi:MAG TPA: 3-hydroxyanthranilate 3,4-dioxygenase [Stellaceae bacterium]|nr:3-hydroxyanthranilate 3,4-dioxygenase [Stellaceae bacterium]
MKIRGAFSLEAWIEANLPSSLGAIGNREVFKNSDFIFQIIKGPNARNDFHIDPWDEIFYQLRGHIFLDVVEDGAVARHRINEGELFLLPKNTFHSPRRPPGSVGLVVERPRLEGEEDGIAWFCERCGNMLHSVRFWCQDIETQLKKHVDAFNASEISRTCKNCFAVLPDPTKVPQWQGDGWK